MIALACCNKHPDDNPGVAVAKCQRNWTTTGSRLHGLSFASGGRTVDLMTVVSVFNLLFLAASVEAEVRLRSRHQRRKTASRPSSHVAKMRRERFVQGQEPKKIYQQQRATRIPRSDRRQLKLNSSASGYQEPAFIKRVFLSIITLSN